MRACERINHGQGRRFYAWLHGSNATCDNCFGSDWHNLSQVIHRHAPRFGGVFCCPRFVARTCSLLHVIVPLEMMMQMMKREKLQHKHLCSRNPHSCSSCSSLTEQAKSLILMSKSRFYPPLFHCSIYIYTYTELDNWFTLLSLQQILLKRFSASGLLHWNTGTGGHLPCYLIDSKQLSCQSPFWNTGTHTGTDHAKHLHMRRFDCKSSRPTWLSHLSRLW